MLKKQDIVKLEVDNKIFTKDGIGTTVHANMLQFDGNNLTISYTKKDYFYKPFKNAVYSNEYKSKGGNVEIEVPFQSMPNILSLNTGVDCLLFDTKSYFFEAVYPDIEPNQANFIKALKRFSRKSTNGMFCFPLNVGEEFVRDLFVYADANVRKMFAKRLAAFAEGNALRLTKTR